MNAPYSPPSREDAEEKPLDPAVERVRQKLMRFMMITMGLTFALVAVVVTVALYRAFSTPTRSASAVVPDTSWIVKQLALPAGTRVTGASLDGKQALVTLETPTGAALWLVDIETATVIRRIELVR